MTSLKLKFKIETLYKILKYSPIDEKSSSHSSKLTDCKQRNKPSSAKQSVRGSKILSNDYETLPGWEQEIEKLSLEDKDEVIDFMKSLDFSSLLSIFTILQNRQFYFKIKSKIGLDIIRTTFKELLKAKNEMNSLNSTYYSSDILNLQDSLFINNECELYYSLKEIINLSELDAMDLFDLFKFNEFFAITEQIFITLIYLLSACECGHLEDFFNIFSEDIFGFISGSEKFLSLTRLKEMGRILGFNEKVLFKAANDLSLELNSYVDSSKFKNFYTFLAKIHDEQFKSQMHFAQSSQHVASQSKGKQESKGKTTTGCMSKACNIL